MKEKLDELKSMLADLSLWVDLNAKLDDKEQGKQIHEFIDKILLVYEYFKIEDIKLSDDLDQLLTQISDNQKKTNMHYLERDCLDSVVDPKSEGQPVPRPIKLQFSWKLSDGKKKEEFFSEVSKKILQHFENNLANYQK